MKTPNNNLKQSFKSPFELLENVKSTAQKHHNYFLTKQKHNKTGSVNLECRKRINISNDRLSPIKTQDKTDYLNKSPSKTKENRMEQVSIIH